MLSHPGENVAIDLRLLADDGSARWVEVVATNLLTHPRVGGVLVMLRDIGTRKEAERLAGNLAQLLDASPDIVVMFDHLGAPLYCNPAAIEAAGTPATEPLQRPQALRDLIARLSRHIPTALTFATTEPWEGEVTLSVGAETRTYSVVVLAARHGTQLDFFACIGREITDRKRLEAQLAHRAFHDGLTGLPNRAALLDRLGRLLRDQPTNDRHLGVMFLDLDNLKDVNDSLGHEVGDALLVEVARRLREATRPDDVVCRLGGDEFVILCPGLPTPSGATEIAERIRRTVTGTLRLDRHDVFVSASIGVAVVPPRWSAATSPADDALRMLRDADTAMYDAKQRGRARVVEFADEMHERVADRLRLTTGLHRAVVEGQLDLVYQPVVAIPTGRLVAFEALLRWHHPELGMLNPTQFVELAEESGVILTIGSWALERALGDIAGWRRGVPAASGLSVNVNVSGRQLLDPAFAEMVGGMLLAHQLDSSALVLEVTESTLVREAAGEAGNIERLRRLGLGVAIDDFGTGYSSLAYLRQLAVDQLKLDGSFVADIDSSPTSAAIVKAVIEMAHAIGIEVVAEAVSSPAQLETLRRLGCDRAQGYLLGRPTAAAEVPELIDRSASAVGR